MYICSLYECVGHSLFHPKSFFPKHFILKLVNSLKKKFHKILQLNFVKRFNIQIFFVTHFNIPTNYFSYFNTQTFKMVFILIHIHTVFI